MYSIKEMFYSLQGEGAHTGRPALFIRFSGCNLWNGREADRASSVCRFCDTDFIGTDGQNGGKFADAAALVKAAETLWPAGDRKNRYVIFTGGEPTLQLDSTVTAAFHQAGFTNAIETNGTRPLPEGLDWVCLSPKGASDVILKKCDELKLVYPQQDALPEKFGHIDAALRYLSPRNPPEAVSLRLHEQASTAACVEYCLQHPQWRLCLQTHKLLRID